MNTTIQRCAPPLAVIGIALYLGWPPTQPLDLGEDLVRAKAVRWKASDLDPPQISQVTLSDPFAASNSSALSAAPNDQVKGLVEPSQEAPRGPTEDDLMIGLKLGGIAHTGDRPWAIINGRVCRSGDSVDIVGLVDAKALIRQINADSVVVQFQDLKTTIRADSRENARKRNIKQGAAVRSGPGAPGMGVPFHVRGDTATDDDRESPQSSSPPDIKASFFQREN